jgi:hypothetical protein
MYQESDNFWSIHQTMSDGNIWCVKSRTRRVDEMTKDIVNRYRAEVKSIYGNRKRHRQ